VFIYPEEPSELILIYDQPKDLRIPLRRLSDVISPSSSPTSPKMPVSTGRVAVRENSLRLVFTGCLNARYLSALSLKKSPTSLRRASVANFPFLSFRACQDEQAPYI